MGTESQGKIEDLAKEQKKCQMEQVLKRIRVSTLKDCRKDEVAKRMKQKSRPGSESGHLDDITTLLGFFIVQ